MNEKIKQIYKTRYWHRINQQENLLIDQINNSTNGFCLIREGDGEIKILHKKDKLCKLLVDAFNNADIIGFGNLSIGMAKRQAPEHLKLPH